MKDQAIEYLSYVYVMITISDSYALRTISGRKYEELSNWMHNAE